jgi:hypothetical protein
MFKETKLVAILAIVLIGMLGCGEPKKSEFEEEMALVIKAGKNQLTLAEKKDLKKQNHPILMQIGDPNTQKLLSLFANLPQDAHNELLESGYLKWRFAELDRERQQVYQEFVRFNIEISKTTKGSIQSCIFSPSITKGRCGLCSS